MNSSEEPPRSGWSLIAADFHARFRSYSERVAPAMKPRILLASNSSIDKLPSGRREQAGRSVRVAAARASTTTRTTTARESRKMLNPQQIWRHNLHRPVPRVPAPEPIKVLLHRTKLRAVRVNGGPKRGHARVLRRPVRLQPALRGAELRPGGQPSREPASARMAVLFSRGRIHPQTNPKPPQPCAEPGRTLVDLSPGHQGPQI